MTEYNRMAKGSFTSTGAAKYINLPFVPDYVELINYTASAAFTDARVLSAQWDVNMGQGFAITQVRDTTYKSDSVITNGISTFSAGLALQYGTAQQVVASTGGATTCSFQVTAHGYAVGDVVVFEGLYSTQYTAGMPQMCNIPFRVTTVTDANNFVVTWASNGSNYTNLAASPSGATVKKVLYPFLYAPGVSVINAVTVGSTTTVGTTAPHNFVVGQEVAIRMPDRWIPSGTNGYNSLPNASLPGSPIYGYVVSVTNSTTVVININSSSFGAFSTNVAVANVPGLSPPQIIAVGDVNTGGVAISSGSALYPPPSVNGVNTINGPAIQGAFVNNTSAGFIIGAGTCVTATTAVLVGANTNVIYWRAMAHDISIT